MFRRLMRALGAIFAALFVFLAMPAGLYIFGPNPWPAFVAFANDPMMRDDGSLLLAVITVIGWVSWAYFILGLLIEIIGRIFGRSPRIPGLGPAQMLAGLILAAITTTTIASTIASSRAAATSHSIAPSPAVVVASVLHTEPSSTTEIAAAPVAHEKYVTHVVQRGETVLDLAERYYHNPDAFTRILDANIGLPQPGGKALQPKEIKVLPGWTLRIPSPEINPAASPATNTAMTLAAETSASAVYQIESGDYLWSVAERFLGDGERYPEIAECNPGLIADPDLIEPGWQLTLPADAHDTGTRAHATGGLITPPSDHDTPAATAPTVVVPPSPAESAAPTGPNQTAPAHAPSSPAAQPSPTEQASTDTAEHQNDEAHAQDPTAHVALPSGAWITTGLAVALTTSLLLGEINRRRKRKPQFPIPLSPAAAEPPKSDDLRAAVTAGLSTLRGQLDTTPAAAVHEPETVSSVAITSSGNEISLHEQLSGLTVLNGPGANGAARAIITAALSSSIRRWGKNQAELITDTATLTGLLDGADYPTGAARLSVQADAEAAIKALEHEVIYRSSFVAMYDTDTITELHADPDHDPLELLVWVGAADPVTAPRLIEVARQGHLLGIDVFVLGDLPGHTGVHVADDGALTVPSGHTLQPLLDHGRIATLGPAGLAEALAILAAAAYRLDDEDEQDAPSDEIPRSEAGTGSDLAVHGFEPDPGQPQLPAPALAQDAPVRLRVLGSPSMSTATVEHINFGRKYAYPMLALLAAYPHGRTLSELIVGSGIDLRPDLSQPPKTAHERERDHKSYAKATINAGIRAGIKAAGGHDGKLHLRHHGDVFRLDPETVDIDLWRMHAHLNDANNATDDEAILDALRRAVACYTGDFAPDIDMEWANHYRNVYRSQILDAYNKIVELTEVEQPDLALAYLRKATDIAQVNEPLYQTMMRIYRRLGHKDAVERTMAILQDRLLAWTDTAEPSPTTQRIYDRMIAQLNEVSAS